MLGGVRCTQQLLCSCALQRLWAEAALSGRYEQYYIQLLRSLSKKHKRAHPAPDQAVAHFHREWVNIEAAMRSAQARVRAL